MLKECQAPTRILQGTGAVIFAQERAAILDRRLPNSRREGVKLFFRDEGSRT
jgi:hypothetical protein